MAFHYSGALALAWLVGTEGQSSLLPLAARKEHLGMVITIVQIADSIQFSLFMKALGKTQFVLSSL